MNRRILLAIALAMAPAASAVAQPTAGNAVQVSCTFLEVNASKGKGGIDPALKPIERKLTRGPFKTWSEFKLLSQAQKTLAKKKTENVALKHGAATGTLVEIVDKSKARLTLTVDSAKGKRVVDTTVTVDAADYVILTHELAGGDGHLVAVTCK